MTSHAAQVAATLHRPTVDLRHLLPGRVVNQGSRPLCVPISLTAAHEAVRNGHPDRPFAVEPLWAHCVDGHGAGPTGTTLSAGGEGLAAVGQPAALVWPWNPTIGHGTEPEPAGATTAEYHRADLDVHEPARDGVEADIEDTLASGVVVVLVIELSAEFDSPCDGIVGVPDLTSPAGAYHAVTAVGARTVEAVRCLLVANSWGPGWGLGGYAWLPLDYLITFAPFWAAIDPSSLSTVGTSQE